jgi:glyoxylase-like metal-dependent hydrolase (beta-lactamase superfamily II)
MRKLIAACLLPGVASVAWGAPATGPLDHELVPLRDGVYLIRRPEPTRQPVAGNITVIVNEQDVVVVDAGAMPLAAENAIRLIRTVTDKPVSVLVNTHWHGDHNLGNQVFRAKFPGIRIVSHENTRRNMLGKAMGDVTKYHVQIDDFLKQLEELKAKGDWSERREGLLADTRTLRGYFDDAPLALTPPDVTFTDRLVLHRGERRIEVLFLGKGNTDGDAVVWLPREKIVATGDLVVHPLPYGFGSYPKEWIATLDAIGRLPFEILVPGHGEVQRDRAYLQQLTRTLADLREQARAAVAKGQDLDAFKKAIDTSSFERQFTNDEATRKLLFNAWWIEPISRSLWYEASGKPILQDDVNTS